jgi:hypothetical protein
MNRVLSWLQNLLLVQVLTILLVGFIFLTQAIGYSNALADETVQSSYGYYYKGTPEESTTGNNQMVDKAKNNLKETAENIRQGAKKLTTPSERVVVDESGKTDTVQSSYGYYYKGTPDANKAATDTQLRDVSNNNSARPTTDAQIHNVSNNPASNSNPFKEIADNVREKLNLDEPLPESTKEFLGTTQKKVDNAVEPITGTKEGYYQTP